jgi:hypothetical protein
VKNIQVIDDARNCTYDIFAVTDAEFDVLFPNPGQDIEFIEDVVERLGDECVGKLMMPVWKRLVNKPDVVGIHATLFYGLIDEKKRFYPTKKSSEMTGH